MVRRQPILLLMIAGAAVFLVVSKVSAWSETGHHLVALLAYDLLQPDEQHQLLTVLASHPRYAEDFTPPKKGDNADRFRIGTAGYWPDIARDQPIYNRPNWHYQLGAALVLGDATKCKIPEFPGPLPAGSTLQTKGALHRSGAGTVPARNEGRSVIIAGPSHRPLLDRSLSR